eukprot:gb/GECH01001660.1/.p1 GENE.gb/GECH01001660.1/~~gb/GECH01001660.1/.p1  ORF type:complete len:710 (+),score=171.64 gb/GECH01001660.1/:1-2130(+)
MKRQQYFHPTQQVRHRPQHVARTYVSESKLSEFTEYLSHKTPIDDTRSTGLFGNARLRTPDDFTDFWKSAQTKCEQLRYEILHNENPKQLLSKLDDMSNTMCLVLDAAECCRNVHPDPNFSEAANDTYQQFGAYLHGLNGDQRLYDAMANLVHDIEKFAALSSEEQQTLLVLKRDMEQSGIHLPQDIRERVAQIHVDIDQMALYFQQISSEIDDDDDNNYILLPLDDINLPKYQFSPEKLVTLSNGQINVKIHKADRLSTYLEQCHPSSHVRKAVYSLEYNENKTSLQCLDAMLNARHQLAQTLSTPSYADLALRHNLAESPENVWSFLKEISHQVKQQTSQELKALSKMKQSQENDTNIYQYDLAYYRRMYLAPLQVNTRDYFPLDNCLKGLYILCYNLFGLHLEPVDLLQGEAWHHDIKKLAIRHDDEGVVGYLYLDLFPRSNKFSHAAHFTIQCGTQEQIPIVALVCNFSSGHSYKRKGASISMPLLNYSEVCTLFHEFGHALHGILGRTKYQNVSGTRTLIDFVETPSELMERFVKDYRVLSKFAKHKETDEPIPESVVHQLISNLDMFRGLDTEQQIFYSMIDMQYHGEHPMTVNGRSHASTTDVAAYLKDTYTSVPHVPNTHPQTNLTHLSNYAASYYSYLFARAHSLHIWQQLFASDPLSRSSGELYWRELLSQGGSKHPKRILKSLLNEEPRVEQLVHSFI